MYFFSSYFAPKIRNGKNKKRFKRVPRLGLYIEGPCAYPQSMFLAQIWKMFFFFVFFFFVFFFFFQLKI